MDGDKASRFVSSLVKSIQALCNGYIDFSSSIEVIGHIHLNIDRSVKLDYVLTEEVSKSISEGATVFASHSYHSHPPSSLSSKSASDTPSRNRQKHSSNVLHGDEDDSSGFRSEVHNTSIKSDIHSHKRSSELYADSGDLVSPKHENRQQSCLTSDSSERRRRSIPLPSQPHKSSSPAAKRSRQSDYNPDPQEFEVIEIKEEPDDEPAVFFGNSSAGQDLQTPDFSSVVMESLDRVGQVEGTNLVGGGGDGAQMPQQQPFPVMMHSNSGMPSSSASSSVPGPSLSDPQDQSFASTSGTSVATGSQDRYTQEDVETAVELVRSKQMSLNGASKVFKIPYSTLGDKVRGRRPVQPGPKTWLSDGDERKLVQRLSALSKRSFKGTTSDVREVVKKILDERGEQTVFKDNRPGKDWVLGFFKRHPELSKKLKKKKRGEW